MTNEKRLLDGDEPELASHRDVLRAASAFSPPAQERDAVWSAICAVIPPPVPPQAPTEPPAPSTGPSTQAPPPLAPAAAGAAATGSVGIAVKVSVVALGTLLLGTGVWLAATAGDVFDKRSTVPAVAASASDAAPALPAVSTVPADAGPSAFAIAPSQPKPPGPASSNSAHGLAGPVSSGKKLSGTSDQQPASELAEESAMLKRARNRLEQGDPAGALALTEQARVRFKRGMLGQEREAIVIEALSRLGRKGEASSRAEAFVRAHPRSVHAARIRTFISP